MYSIRITSRKSVYYKKNPKNHVIIICYTICRFDNIISLEQQKQMNTKDFINYRHKTSHDSIEEYVTDTQIIRMFLCIIIYLSTVTTSKAVTLLVVKVMTIYFELV